MLGGLKFSEVLARQRAREERQEARRVPEEVRAARAQLLEERDAIAEAVRQEEAALRTVPERSLKRVLASAATEDLRDLRARRGRLVVDRIWDLIAEVLDERAVERHSGPTATTDMGRKQA